jgi:serine/threonine protein kinase
MAGIFVMTFLTMYVMMTRHVVLHSSSTPGGVGTGAQSEPLWSNHARILYQPVVFLDPEIDAANIGKGERRKRGHRVDISFCCLPKKPLIVGYYFADPGPFSFLGLERLDPHLVQSYDSVNTRIQRQLMTKEEVRRQLALEDSDDYENGAAETIQDQGKDCIAQYDWQESFFPTCNFLMEVDVTHLLPQLEKPGPRQKEIDNRDRPNPAPPASLTPSLASSTDITLISSGYWRDVWRVNTNVKGPEELSEKYVLKTIRYTHSYTPRNYDRHRRDAVAMERLTASPFIMNIYAACGNSGLFEYADGGSLEDSIWHAEDDTDPWTSEERLVVAYQAAAGVADLHNIGKEGVPSIAHTDITPGQFVYVDDFGVYKLNDFNRARFIGWNKRTNSTCGFHVGNNPGTVSEYHHQAGKANDLEVLLFVLHRG